MLVSREAEAVSELIKAHASKRWQPGYGAETTGRGDATLMCVLLARAGKAVDLVVCCRNTLIGTIPRSGKRAHAIEVLPASVVMHCRSPKLLLRTGTIYGWYGVESTALCASTPIVVVR